MLTLSQRTAVTIDTHRLPCCFRVTPMLGSLSLYGHKVHVMDVISQTRDVLSFTFLSSFLFVIYCDWLILPNLPCVCCQFVLRMLVVISVCILLWISTHSGKSHYLEELTGAFEKTAQSNVLKPRAVQFFERYNTATLISFSFLFLVTVVSRYQFL